MKGSGRKLKSRSIWYWGPCCSHQILSPIRGSNKVEFDDRGMWKLGNVNRVYSENLNVKQDVWGPEVGIS